MSQSQRLRALRQRVGPEYHLGFPTSGGRKHRVDYSPLCMRLIQSSDAPELVAVRVSEPCGFWYGLACGVAP